MNHSKMLVAGWVFLLAVAGCASSDEADPVPVEQFPQKFASDLCAAIAPCCKDAALTHVPATCKSNATDRFTQLVVSANGRKINYDANAAGECLSQIKAAYASCQMPTFVTAPACGHVFTGTVPTGGACFTGECATGICTTPTNATSAIGVCMAASSEPQKSSAIEGAQCEPHTYDCGANLYCPEETALCTKLAAIGGSCTSVEGCQIGAFCSGSGVCTAQYDSGPCETAETYNACSTNSYCDYGALGTSATGQCVKKKPEGYACREDQECVKGLCNGTCGPPPAASDSSCAGTFIVSSTVARD